MMGRGNLGPFKTHSWAGISRKKRRFGSYIMGRKINPLAGVVRGTHPPSGAGISERERGKKADV